MAASTGTEHTRLVIVRGNSGAGKTSVAFAVRSHLGRTCALVQQDVIRRTILKERDVPDGANIGLMSLVARYALDQGYHVLIEGILSAEHYSPMLTGLASDHRGTTTFYYLDVTYPESLRRHATRPQSAEFGAEHMAAWYRHRDVLDMLGERVVPQSSTLEQTTARILDEAFGRNLPTPAHRTAMGNR